MVFMVLASVEPVGLTSMNQGVQVCRPTAFPFPGLAWSVRSAAFGLCEDDQRIGVWRHSGSPEFAVGEFAFSGRYFC